MRLEAVEIRCLEMVTDLRTREGTLHQRMDAMLGQRFRDEVDAIGTLITTIKTAVEEVSALCVCVCVFWIIE